jgi:RNA polymerase sigma-54 factor
MLKTGQYISQSQQQQQRMSPQQIQYVKLLQLPAIALEQRIKEEMEMNPVLEELDSNEEEERLVTEEELNERNEKEDADPDPVDQNDEIDWDSFLPDSEYEGDSYQSRGSSEQEEWRDLPNPYYESFLENLENQVSLLDLNDEEILIADQIVGSLDEMGYFRRDPEAVVDNIAFNHGILVSKKDVEKVRRQIQQLEPVGIASSDLRDCLIVQLEMMDNHEPARDKAVKMLRDEWESFEKKHFEKLMSRLGIDEETLQDVFDLIRTCNPSPGHVANDGENTTRFIEPDFEVYFKPGESDDSEEGFIIRLTQKNMPPLRISPKYKALWDDMKNNKSGKQDKETKAFIKEKIESAQWFMDSIRQRQNTLMNTMQTIVSLQEDFFKYGEGLKPMILKDIAERVSLDISTISRVVNGKYVQTDFGVYELKYFFSEGLETESGEEVSNREVKKLLSEIIDGEDKNKPLSDHELSEELKKRGFKVARRTVSKYREQLNQPVARLRRQII